MGSSFVRRAIVVSVAASCAVAATTASALAQAKKKAPKHVVVVSGLNNPRQLALPHGQVLLVAEAGKGGTLGTVPDPEGGTMGLGYTGSISAVLGPARAHGQDPLRIVTGLLSGAAATASEQGPVGSGAVGSTGVAAASLSKIVAVETTFEPGTPPAAKKFDGRLLKIRPFQQPRSIADITGYENKHNPDGHEVLSNPYAVVAFGGGWLVADAAANDILKVDRWGHVSVFHVFGNVTDGACSDPSIEDPPGFPGCNFVPTSMAVDRWGQVYVGGLSSLVPTAAKVVKLSSNGHHVLHTWSGFTSVTGLALGSNGSLYVSQLFADSGSDLPGVLTKVNPNGHRTNTPVPFPTGIATDRGGNVYVSAFSIGPDSGMGIPGLDTSGQVWRLHF